MSELSDRRLGGVFGILGAVLIALEGLVALARGVVYLAVGRSGVAYRPFDQALIFLVAALIIGLFALLGATRREGRATVAGVVLIVLVIVGWLELGFSAGVLALLGALLTLVAGIVFLVSGR
jgi:hypothetical protein